MVSTANDPAMASAPQAFVAQTFATPISAKLNDDNFLTWRQHAELTIKGYRLKKHILGPDSIPEKFEKEGEKITTQIAPDFENYEQQDCLLKSWLLESMENQFKVHVVGCEWSYQVWETLHNYFASQTKARIKQLKIQLRGIRKTSSISLYLLEIKKIVDTLAAIGSPLSAEEHVDAIFDGLPEEYDGFVTSVLSRTKPYFVLQIEALLMAQEECLEKHKRHEGSSLQANLAQGNNSQKKFSNFQGRGSYGRGGDRGRGRNMSKNSSNGGRGKIQCQLCANLAILHSIVGTGLINSFLNKLFRLTINKLRQLLKTRAMYKQWLLILAKPSTMKTPGTLILELPII
jgi:histone deacetylase 1/2